MQSNARPFPVLATRRLVLRAPLPEDAAAFGNILSIPDVTRYSNWPDAPSNAQLERSMRWMRKAYSSGKGCAWIIEERSSNTIAGAIRFNSFEIKWRCGEIGYELHPDFWGKGLMTEAVALWRRAAIRFSASTVSKPGPFLAIRRRTGCWRNRDFDMKGRCDREDGSREPTTTSACLDGSRTMSRLMPRLCGFLIPRRIVLPAKDTLFRTALKQF